MRHDTRITLAAAFAGLLAASAPALSAPAPQPAQPTREQIAEHMAAAEKPITGWPALVVEARKYMGTNPTDRKRLWCATFMNFVLAKLGYAGTHSDAAKSFAYYGKRISQPRIGAIAVLTRGKRGGHVGVVSGIDPHGNPIIISGNHNDRVGEGVYPRARVIAYVMPTERHPATMQLAARSLSSLVPDKSFDWPITELIAAIEAEQAHAEKPARAAAPPPPARRRAVQPAPERHLVVQQTPQRIEPPPVQRLAVQRARAPRPPAQRPVTAHKGSPLEPLLTKLFGPDDRVAPRPQHRARARHAPSSRVAANAR
jgi:uncharacterized protein (TIGR02594 family)